MMTNCMLFPPQPQIIGLLKIMSLLTLRIKIMDFIDEEKKNQFSNIDDDYDDDEEDINEIIVQ